jgi:hypothetical protein
MMKFQPLLTPGVNPMYDRDLQRQRQGCQMVCFQTKNPNLGKFGGTWNGKCWYIFWSFGIFYGQLVYFIAI